MHTVIYLDVLLLTNFLIAYGSLSAAGVLAGVRAGFGRMLTASVLAAFSALILFAPPLPYAMQVGYRLATALGIAAAAFAGRGWRRVLAAACWFAALNLLLAGLCMLVILQTDTDLLRTGNLAVYLRLSPLILLVGCGVCSAAVWGVLRLLHPPGAPEKITGLELELCDSCVRLRGALDTGCHLKDPVTCLPVLLISYPGARSRLPAAVCDYLDEWFGGERPSDAPDGLALRLIPCATAAGRTVLPGFAVGQIGLITRTGVLSLGRSAVAFTQQPFGGGEYEALYGADFL